jgi:hypothetical protein
LALGVLRETCEPLPIRVIAVRMLAMKGVILPGPTLRHEVRKRVRIMFANLDRRGVTARVGDGREAKRAIARPEYPEN